MVDGGKYRLHEFELYNLARAFRKSIYELIRQLPSKEHYCLEPQMRKAIISVTNNIAEGTRTLALSRRPPVLSDFKRLP